MSSLLYRKPRLLLTALTLICLAPFCRKAFHIDDPLFLWAAQNITHHPLDPYNFPVVWYTESAPMSEVTENPPAASYYMAAAGKLGGWSEPTLHFAFLLPALVAVLGTYYLAQRFTRYPSFAAIATLLTPGFLVSSTTVMCDTTMLALWILAAALWLEGMDRESPAMVASAALLIAVCALTKYFGIALIPLLLLYSILRRGRAEKRMLFLLLPVLTLTAYQFWTRQHYGTGLLAEAAAYALDDETTRWARILNAPFGLAFVGGCALTALTFIPVLWSRSKIWIGAILSAAFALAFAAGWIPSPTGGAAPGFGPLSLQLGIFVAGGISLLGIAFADWRERKDADSAFLGSWVVGTFVFATFFNWTINARSVLPLIPPAGILLARRLDAAGVFGGGWRRAKVVAPLALSGIVSIWVAFADARFAGSARDAAEYVRDHIGSDPVTVSFEGHWGFQYYMQLLGFRPVDYDSYEIRSGNIIVIPQTATNAPRIPRELVESQSTFALKVNVGVTTTSRQVGGGFYAGVLGPLPYVFGSVPDERYLVVRLRTSGTVPRLIAP